MKLDKVHEGTWEVLDEFYEMSVKNRLSAFEKDTESGNPHFNAIDDVKRTHPDYTFDGEEMRLETVELWVEKKKDELLKENLSNYFAENRALFTFGRLKDEGLIDVDSLDMNDVESVCRQLADEWERGEYVIDPIQLASELGYPEPFMERRLVELYGVNAEKESVASVVNTRDLTSKYDSVLVSFDKDKAEGSRVFLVHLSGLEELRESFDNNRDAEDFMWENGLDLSKMKEDFILLDKNRVGEKVKVWNKEDSVGDILEYLKQDSLCKEFIKGDIEKRNQKKKGKEMER